MIKKFSRLILQLKTITLWTQYFNNLLMSLWRTASTFFFFNQSHEYSITDQSALTAAFLSRFDGSKNLFYSECY